MDFENFVDNAAKPEDGVKNLQELVDEVELLEQQTDELEESLASLNSRRNYLVTRLIPDAVNTIQAEEWKSATGLKVKLAHYVTGALPKDPEQRKAAMDWIENNGGGPLLKGALQVPFNKSQHNEALALKADIEAKGYTAIYEPTIHSSVYAAFVREKLRNGENIPGEILGIYTARVAQITKPTTRRKKPNEQR